MCNTYKELCKYCLVPHTILNRPASNIGPEFRSLQHWHRHRAFSWSYIHHSTITIPLTFRTSSPTSFFPEVTLAFAGQCHWTKCQHNISVSSHYTRSRWKWSLTRELSFIFFWLNTLQVNS